MVGFHVLAIYMEGNFESLAVYRAMSGIDPQTVGSLLKEARERKGTTLAQAAMALHVRQKYLEAIEAGRIESIAQEIYVAGCVKAYARWLGVPLDERVIAVPQSAYAARVLKAVGGDDASPWWLQLGWLYGWIRLPRQRLAFSACVGILAVYGIWYGGFYQPPLDAPDTGVLMFFP